MNVSTRPAATAAGTTAGGDALARLAFGVAVVMLLVAPLIVDPTVPSAFRSPKAELLGVLWAVLATCFLVGGTARWCWRDSWWLAWGGVLLGGLASTLACAQPLRVVVALLPLAAAALGSAALRLLPTARRLQLANLVVVSGVIQAAIAIPLVGHAVAPATLRIAGGASGRSAWIGTLGNPADVSVFLLLPAVLALSLALAHSPARPWLLAAAAAMAGVIVGTRTLSTIVALAMGAGAAVLRGAGARRRLLAAIALVAVGGALLLTPPMRAKLADEVAEVRAYGWAGLGSSRGAAAAAALAMVARHPLTGVGFGLFERGSFTYLDEQVLAERGRRIGLETAFGEAHNDFLQHTAETGILGVLLALAGFAVASRRGRGASGVLPDRTALLVAATVIATVQFPLHLAIVAAQWAVLAALALPPLVVPPRHAVRRASWRWVAVVTVAVIACAIAWQRRVAWQAVRQGEEIATAAAAGPAAPEWRARQHQALADLEPRLQWLPYRHQALATAGNLAFATGEREAALERFAAALSLAERPEYRFNLGMALLALDERATGLENLMAAVKLNPAMFARIGDPSLSRALRLRLDADGYGTRHPWIYAGTPAAAP